MIMETKELNLKEILKGHEGEKFYSSVYGCVTLIEVDDSSLPIAIKSEATCNTHYLTSDGKLYNIKDTECILFPSKEQRDWNKWIEEQRDKGPKTWKEMECHNERVWDTIRLLEYWSTDQAIKSAIAFLKIHQLIEYGYGGNITHDEWNNGDFKYAISWHESALFINGYYLQYSPVAFRTKKLAEEFLSYPENERLVKDYFMTE